MTHPRTRTPYGWAACIFLCLTLLCVWAFGQPAFGQPAPTPAKRLGFCYPEPVGKCACVCRYNGFPGCSPIDCKPIDTTAHPYPVLMDGSRPMDPKVAWQRWPLHVPAHLYYPGGQVPAGQEGQVLGYVPGGPTYSLDYENFLLKAPRLMELQCAADEWGMADECDCRWHQELGEAWEDLTDWLLVTTAPHGCPTGVFARGPMPVPTPQPTPEPTPPPQPAPTATPAPAPPPADPCPPGTTMGMTGRCVLVGPAPQPQPTPTSTPPAPQPTPPAPAQAPSACPVERDRVLTLLRPVLAEAETGDDVRSSLGDAVRAIERCYPTAPCAAGELPVSPPVVACPSCPVVACAPCPTCAPVPPPPPKCAPLSARSAANLRLLLNGHSLIPSARRRLDVELKSPTRKGCVQP